MIRQATTTIALVCLIALCGAARAAAPKAEAKIPLPAELQKQVQASIDRGLKYLAATQGPKGGWMLQPGPAITALVGQCFAQDDDYGPTHPIVRRALECVLSYQQPDGGLYDATAGLRNYNTSICLMFLSSLPGDNVEVRQAKQKAVEFLKKLQWAEHRTDSSGKRITPDHAWYGGAGYGRHKRPDLSNTQMMIEALHQSGLPPSDQTYKKALKFISRCQMSSETNDQPFARTHGDGGFIYTCANDGESKAGTVIEDGKPVLRSYGSMTYAGFKSMLYADVDRNDPRVRRAFDWIRKHYTLDEHPNLPGKQSKQGLFYFYQVFARALFAWGEPTLKTAGGDVHNWRVDLCSKILSLQHKEGYWVNEADRWMEGVPSLVTAYSILSLQTALK